MKEYKLLREEIKDLTMIGQGLSGASYKEKWEVHSWNIIREGNKAYAIFLLEKPFVGKVGEVAKKALQEARLKELTDDKKV